MPLYLHKDGENFVREISGPFAPAIAFLAMIVSSALRNEKNFPVKSEYCVKLKACKRFMIGSMTMLRQKLRTQKQRFVSSPMREETKAQVCVISGKRRVSGNSAFAEFLSICLRKR